jgi:hypothetical protein
MIDFSRCRSVWVPGEPGFWSPPPEHVKIGVQFLLDHPYALLADDMGGMKSAQALIAAQFLHDADLIDRVIIVAPAAVRPKVWFDKDLGQIYEQAFEDKRVIVSEYHSKIRQWEHGPKDASPLRIIVTNYEYIRSRQNLEVLLAYCGPKTMLILDESSAVRGHASAQTEACMLLRWQANVRKRPVLGVPRCGRILELNGTPVAESPLDLFSQANLLHPSILDCKYVTHFKARYAVQEPVLERGKPMVRYGSVVQNIAGWSEEGVKDLQQRLAPYVLRREAKDFGVDFALPPVCLEVTLTKETWKHYVAMRNEMVVWLKSGVATARTAAVKTIRLAQITSGFLGGVEDAGIEESTDVPDLFFDGLSAPISKGEVDRQPWNPQLTVQEIGREKLDFAIAWQKELLHRYPNLKLLAWMRFVPELKRYLKEVQQFGHPVGAACGQKVLDGEMNQKAERDFALRLLHPKTAPVGPATVGATQGTGAMGLNFTACRTVLDISYDFSPWKKRQGDARVNRTGQTGPVSFFYLVAVGPRGQKTIDHHVILHRLGKMNINDLTVSGWVKTLEEE